MKHLSRFDENDSVTVADVELPDWYGDRPVLLEGFEIVSSSDIVMVHPEGSILALTVAQAEQMWALLGHALGKGER